MTNGGSPIGSRVAPGSAVAVIGLGIMGSPMAVNLAKAGFDVVGYSRSGTRTGPLIEAGGAAAGSAAEAVAGADVVLTMLPDSPDVAGVLGGPDGLIASVPARTLIIDCSTIRPDVSVALADQAAKRGLDILDAPVSGGEPGAIEGTLSIMVGGSAEAFDRARPVLNAVGKTVVHVGPSGSGQTVKAANQLVVAGTLELIAEAIVFLEAHGVELGAALEVLGGGLAGSTLLARKGASMAARRFEPGFRVELHDKDLRILVAAASASGAVIPVGGLVAQLMAAVKARGRGGLDHSALLTLVDELSGREGSTPAS
jgi:2-hydroxy-3-oxopropionate reductase